MRLCFISNPNSTHTRRWVGWFARRGHDVCLVADMRLQDEWNEVPVIDLARRFYAPLIRFPIWTIWLRSIIHQWRPDILHAHRVNSAGWLAAASGFHPLVITPWGSDLNLLPQRSPIQRWLAQFTLHRADLVTADAHDLLQKAGYYGARSNSLHLVQWGVDLDNFYPGEGSSSLRAELRLGRGPVILSPRAVDPIYNLDVIIQALPEILEALPGAILVLRDYNTDAAYKRKLEGLISTQGLQGAVRWLGRIEPYERLADIYRLADVVVSVPSSDSTPVSLLEALACGSPVITTDLPALREWINPGESGLMVPARDAHALAEAILHLAVDQDMVNWFRKIGPELVAQHADHEVEMEKMEGLYQGLLG